MKIPIRRRKREAGQAILLVVLAMSIFLLGAVGFAIDGSHLYAQRQMAQAAADASAQAAILTIFGGNTATGFPTGWSAGTSFNCTSGNAAASPCVYAQKNGFGTADTVAVDFPGSISGVTLTPDAFPAKAAHVKVTRSVPTTLMQLLGNSANNVSAEATAAIIQNTSPIPIIVLHPFNPQSFSIGGTPTIQICGGPQRSIQVNSSSSTGASQNGTATVDLSKGGPKDTKGDCTTPGTGTDFAAYGGIASPTGLPSWMTPTGSTEHYYQPAFPISDPFKNVPYPAKPATISPTASTGSNGGPFTSAPPFHGCTAVAKNQTCAFYQPGLYPGGINSTGEVAVFSPGVYWMDDATGKGAKNYGFQSNANSTMMMCTDCAADTSTGGTQNKGMLVYINDQGTFNVGANGAVSLVGSAANSAYLGILFFENRSAPPNTGSGSHSLGGGGGLTLSGTIYTTNTTMTASTFQEMHINGGGSNATLIRGEIVVSELIMGGNGGISMQLDPNLVLPVNKVALVK